MDLRELRLRASPWIALFLGVIWILVELISRRTAVTWGDVYPGVALVGAGLVLFAANRWLNRPFDFEHRHSVDESDLDRPA